jgi:cytoskeletal protein CcmA (bactofilin family)
MFSKPQTKGASAPTEAPQARKLTVASLVAEGVRLQGHFITEGDLHLDGAVEGDVRVCQLTIGETGAVTGTILADSVEIRGRVTGTICARQVRLWATAHVDGDISHTELAIEAGAHFEGRSLALTPAKPAALEALTVVAAE